MHYELLICKHSYVKHIHTCVCSYEKQLCMYQQGRFKCMSCAGTCFAMTVAEGSSSVECCMV